MAKKAQATKKSAEQAVSISRLKLNQLFFESLLIVQGFLGIFVIISLFTYSSQDPGWNSQTFSNPLVGEEFGVSNAVGSWGAYLSDFLFTIVGYMAYLVPYWLLWPLIRHFIFFRRPIQFSQIYSGLIGIRILGWSLFLISSSTLLSIFIEPGSSFLPEDTGGLIGSAVSSYTLEPLSFIGSSLLFICLGLLGLTLSLEISWTTLIIKAQEYLIEFGGEFGEKSADFLTRIREKQRLRQDKVDRQQRVLEEVKKKEKIKAPEVIEAKEKIETSNRVQQEKQEELFEYKEAVNPPKLSLLDKKTEELSNETSEHSLRQLGNLVISKLSEYGISIPEVVPFSFRDLAERIGWSTFGGRQAKEIYHALHQLKGMDVTCWGYNKETKQWANVTFNIITRMYAFGSKGCLAEGYVHIDPIIISNLTHSYHRSLNYTRMETLEPIQMALYKQIYNVFSTRYSHGQNPVFEKNYSKICSDWLGGLKQHRHQSKIREQLDLHLQALKEVKLLRGYKIERNSSNGWKIAFTPGKGFREDYENFYLRKKQPELQFAYHADKKEIQEPIDVISLFYKKLYSYEDTKSINVFSNKEVDFARELLKQVEGNSIIGFIEFSLSEAASTNFDIKTFCGVRQYIPAWKKVEQQLKDRELILQKKKRQEKDERLESLYQEFRRDAIHKIRNIIQKHEITDLEEQVQQQLLDEGAQQLGLKTMVYFKTNSVLAEKYNIPTFTEWKEQKQEELQTTV